MSILFCQKNGFPFLVDSDNLPRTEENKSLERFMQIAVALDREGFNGIRVTESRTKEGRYVQFAERLEGSLGAAIFDHLVDYSHKRKSIPTVEAALIIANSIREFEDREISHDN